MKVLHVYDENNPLVSQYVAMLTTATADRVDMSSATDAAEFKRLYEENTPDIVHIHAKPTFTVPKGFRLVVTPHGKPLTVTRFYVAIARSRIEYEELAKKCNRIETVLNPIITRTITPEGCARQMLTIYQRVMDSNVWELMDDDTRRALAELLCAAICGDRRWVGAYPHKVNYRLLYAYAEHEGVLPLIEHGISLLDITAPPKEATDGYLPKGFTLPQPMTGKGIADLLTDIKTNGISLLRMTELATALRSPLLDEEKLMIELNDKHLRPLFASTLQLLRQHTLLTEGFMPCTPAENSETQRLRMQLANRQSVV